LEPSLSLASRLNTYSTIECWNVVLHDVVRRVHCRGWEVFKAQGTHALQPHAKHHLKFNFLARSNKTRFARNTIWPPIDHATISVFNYYSSY
jgi:hypothetical protein